MKLTINDCRDTNFQEKYCCDEGRYHLLTRVEKPISAPKGERKFDYHFVSPTEAPLVESHA